MNNTKFSMNSLLIVLLVFSAIGLFVTVGVYDMAGSIFVMNQYVPIEGTDLSVRYSTIAPNGIYQGPENTAKLMLEGDFGYDWGVAAVGDALYLNEYSNTSLGMTLSNLVKVDMATFEKEEILRNAILRGTCASGELVCVGDAFLPSNSPETNSLLKFYAMTFPTGSTGTEGTVMFLDSETGNVLYEVKGPGAASGNFRKKYLDRTLSEVMK